MPNDTYEKNKTSGSLNPGLSYNGSAAVQPRPAVLPEEKQVQQKQKAPRAKLTVAPFAAIGMVVVVALLMMVVYNYVRLFEATNRVGELNQDLTSAQANAAKLRSTYESRIDLAAIEARARELGMNQPTAKQTVYLNIAGADHAEVLQVDNRSFLEKAWDAITGSVTGITEYFR